MALDLNAIAIISVIIIIIGALTWGWLGVTGVNPITWANIHTFNNSWLERAVYVIVGIAGIIVAVLLGKALMSEKKINHLK